MARQSRFNLPGVPQHVIQRGNNREPCFYSEDDYKYYKDVLIESAEKNQACIHAYVFMTNHVHLLVSPKHEHSISHMMQDLGRKYVRYVNRSYNRTGTLWEGRFKASLVDSDVYLLTCMRYIELNPVRANMVTHPGEYRWSSYACNANGKYDALVNAHSLYMALDHDVKKRQFAYRELFRICLNSELIHEIRDALNQQLVLGREDFKIKIEETTNRQARLKPLGRHKIGETEVSYK